jgi:hypothetical protein
VNVFQDVGFCGLLKGIAESSKLNNIYIRRCMDIYMDRSLEIRIDGWDGSMDMDMDGWIDGD